MPKVPRDVSHDRLVRALLRRGWSVAGEGARHTVLSQLDHEVTVPRHAKLKTGTVSAILKFADISVEEAAREL